MVVIVHEGVVVVTVVTDVMRVESMVVVFVVVEVGVTVGPPQDLLAVKV